MPLTAHRRTGLSPFHLVSNIIVWISAVIVMGIVSYWFSENKYAYKNSHLLYIEIISVLTVAFFLASFVLGNYPGHHLLFQIVFSYLWIVAVAFAASDFSHSHNSLAYTVEAFTFIAFFFLLFNVLYDWYLGYRGAVPAHTTGARTSSRV